MDYMAAQMDNQIGGAISENERLREQLAKVQAERDGLEWALQSLVERCNNDAGLTNESEVIAAEAALERVYKRRAAIARTEGESP